MVLEPRQFCDELLNRFSVCRIERKLDQFALRMCERASMEFHGLLENVLVQISDICRIVC